MIYKFKNIEVQPNKRCILINSEEQNVQPRVFDLLIYLLENRDRAVSKQELQDALWPNMEVTETALTRAVMKARKIIADDGAMIKTIHGHGYHFVEPVTAIKEQEAAPKNSRITQPKFAMLLLVVLVAVVATSLVVLLPDRTRYHSIAVLPVIDDTGNPDLSWTSLGLMSLALQVIKSESNIETVSARTTAKISEELSGRAIPLSLDQLSEVEKITQATHHLVSRLTQNGEDQYKLEFMVHHPSGESIPQTNVGNDPTAMLEQAVKTITQQLGGRSPVSEQRVISNNTFINELYARGMNWQMQGNAAKARDYFQLVKEEEPTLFWPRYELALTTRILGQYVQAEQELLSILEELPEISNDPKAPIAVYNALGLAKQLQQDEPAALEYLKLGFEAAGIAEMPDAEKLIAGNIALSHKRMRQYDEAKLWLARAQQILQLNGLEADGQIAYQLAQLERDTGNNDKALVLFDQAIKVYQSDGKLSFVASGESSKSRILGRQGHWQAAIDLQKQAWETRKELKLPLAVVDSQLSLIELYIDQGQYSAAEALFQDTRERIEGLENQNRFKYLKRAAISMAWEQADYQRVEQLLGDLQSGESNRTMRNIRIKTQWLSGSSGPLQEQLQEYEAKMDQASQFDLLDYWDLKAFVANQEGDPAAEQPLIKAAEQAHQMGLYAKAARWRITLAYMMLNKGEVEQAAATVDGLTFYQLNWWQIDLLKARILHAQGQQQQAENLAITAKENSLEAWLPEHDTHLQTVMTTES